MSERPDPRDRPPDPAGTRPKVDPESLLPEAVEPSVEGEAFEERDEAPRVLLPGEPEMLPEVREPVGALSASEPIPRETKHTPRFQFLLGALLAVGAVALAAAVAIALRPEPQRIDPTAGWSPWRPSADAPITDIVTHVSHEYRLPNQRQLVLVTPAPLAFGGVPAQIVLEQSLEQGGNFAPLEGNAIVYRFCGLGDKCAISEGKPSVERMLLLRREALELALYTFRYIDAADQVVVFLPPSIDAKTKETRLASLLFQRDELVPQIVRPLNATLAHRTPSVAGVESSPDASLVKRLTSLYSPTITQGTAADPAGFFLVLKPFSEATSKPSSSSGAGDLSDLSQLLQSP